MLTTAQLEERKKGIGGSEIAAILGLDRFAGPLDVWLSKTADWTKEPTPDMERGSFLEDGVARWYAHREQVAVDVCGAVVHTQHPWARCTPDRIAGIQSDEGFAERLVSIKCPRFAGEPPDGHILQLQWEDLILATSGAVLLPTFHLVALADGDLSVTPVERDLELQAWLLDYAGAWWKRHVVGKEPPQLDGSEGAARWLKSRFPRDTRPVRTATLDETVLLHELREAHQERLRASEAYELAAQKVKEAVADAGGIESEAVGRVTWKANKNGERCFKPRWNK